MILSVVWGGSWLVGWCRGVVRSWVGGGRVGDGLGPAVGKVDGVGSGDVLAVSGLALGEVGAGVVVVHAVLEGVRLGGLVVVGSGVGGLVGRGGGVVGGGSVVGHGGGDEGGGNDGTDHLEESG